jgi:hypothetical protein
LVLGDGREATIRPPTVKGRPVFQTVKT